MVTVSLRGTSLCFASRKGVFLNKVNVNLSRPLELKLKLGKFYLYYYLMVLSHKFKSIFDLK